MSTYYTCKNQECPSYEKEQVFYKTEHKWNAEKQCFLPEERKCSVCGSVMEISSTINEDPSSVTFNSFDSLSDAGKKEALKKRTQILDKKNDAQGVKEHYKKKTLDKFFGK